MGLVLALWLAAATVWGVLHLWIVPRISEWRPELESLASRTLGIPVTIASLSARRDGLVPAFELGDVALHDPASGGQALHLAKVVVAVSARSLLTLGVEQIYVEAPELTIRRAQDGQIFVAGIAVTTSGSAQKNHADWLLSQPEIALRRGTVQWIDDKLQAPPLALHDVDLVLRNKGWSHSLRLDATPPESWGQRFSLVGRFKEPLLSVHEGRIERWSGQAFMDFAQVDLSQLGQYLEPQEWKLQQGKGSVRAWLEIGRGQPVGMVADVAVEALQLQWKDKPRPLQLQSLQGRLSARSQNGYQSDYQLAVQGLSFTTGDGLPWPRGDFSLHYQPTGATEQGLQGERGEFRADGVDLAIAAQVLRRLPVPEALQTRLQTLAPSGLLRQLQLSWRGPADAPTHYKASGQFEQLELRGQPSAKGPGHTGVPGFTGVSGQFAFDQDSGRARIGKTAQGRQAVLSFPGVFEDPDIPLDALEATVQWQLQGQGRDKVLKVQVPQLRFANDDMAGQLQAKWQTGGQTDGPTGAGGEAEPRFPGLLELQGQLGRANGARIHRYLPLEVGDDARRYVREAVTAGQASAVNFRVKGDLEHFPFEKPHKDGKSRGDFHVEAKVHDVHYQYVPAFLLSPGEKPWPALTRLSGELVFDRNSLHVRKARGMLGSGAVVLDEAQAVVDDWNQTEVEVQAKAHGPLGDMLGIVQTSALSALTEHALDESRGDGPARLALKLHLPIAHTQRSKVSGAVELNGNSVHIVPEAPVLSQVRGTVQFSDTGFSLTGVQARALGGAVKIEGGMKPAAAHATASASGNTAPPVQILVQGLATAKGLQEARELGRLAQMAGHLQGQARYSLQLNLHKTTEFTFQSDLQGMGLQLPAPLGKPVQDALPVRISRRQLAPGADQLSVQWGSAGAALIERKLQDGAAQVQRGSYVLAQGAQADTARLPPQGVTARVEQPRLDLDAWTELLQGLAGASPAATDGGKAAGAADGLRQYLPQQLALKAGELRLHGRQLHEVAVQASHAGKAWSSQITARELAGNIEYREGSPQEPAGQVIARLSRLTIPDAESGLDLVNEQDSAVRELPALQISVDDFRLGARALGHLEVQARNQLLAGSPGVRQWQLSRFDISTAEASLAANGQWSIRHGDKAHPGDTQLHFKLALRDAGQLLKRFDMPGVVANGQGSLQGDIAWTGSPITPDFKTMSGAVHVDVQKGQFLKADPGLAKLLGVLSLQALPRRLTLDFRDVFRNGFSFDFMRGDVQIQKGMARTNNMQMKGVNAAVLMEGSADIDKETQDLHVVVVPEINAMTASLVATAINPVAGLGSFLAQMILRGPLIAANTKEFQIRGSWDDPQVVELPRRASKKGAAESPPSDEPGSNAKMPEPAPPAAESPDRPAGPDAKETP
ncbi:DUF3971 domain-containing protein [Comamonas phosphati]|nr:DUF3971 domain-containing protein [Comamonas phosphati]